MHKFAAVLLLAAVAGCGRNTQATYHVFRDSDRFDEVIHNRLVRYANWQFTVDKQKIDIPHEPSTIVVADDGRHVKIEVNGKTVYDD